MLKSLASLFALSALAVALVGCETAPKTPAERQALRDDAESALQTMYAKDPGLKTFTQNAYGYAIFPSVGKGGALVGGAYGRGAVYEQGNFIGYADLNQANIGLQLGGQTYSELIVFENKAALDRFRINELAFAADASAVAMKAGASASADFRDGVAVFTMPKGGLMFEASVGGQTFNFVPASEANRMNEGQQQDTQVETRTEIRGDTNR